MTTTLLTLTLTILAAEGTPGKKPPKRSAYAPSLPYVSPKEEEKIDKIINQFILADIGRLRGIEALRAKRDFADLGPEAIPSLIRGLNRAARIEHSCPVSVIAKKLARMLGRSRDRVLLEFARDEIGSGVGRTRHAGILQRLRFNILLRRNAVARSSSTVLPSRTITPTPTRRKPNPRLARLSTIKLAEEASIARGPKLHEILVELETRTGEEVLDGLTTAAKSYNRGASKLGRNLLDRHLARKSEAVVKKLLTHKHTEVRKAAIRVAVARFPNLVEEVIVRLDDEDKDIRTAAHQALVQRAKRDLGPRPGASKSQRQQAQRRWLLWWRRYAKR